MRPNPILRPLLLFLCLSVPACGSSGQQPETAHAAGADDDKPWEPHVCTEYSYTPKKCHGSAENPSCNDSFRLRPDGKVAKLFDDIMSMGEFESTSTSVTISIDDFDYEETFQVEANGDVLLSERGERYQSKPCPLGSGCLERQGSVSMRAHES